MLVSVVEVVTCFTIRFSVAELSQPDTAVKPVLVCEPLPVKVNPFHENGNWEGQIKVSELELLTGFTITLSVAELSQPAALVSPVLVCAPSWVKVKPFHTNGKAVGQTVVSVADPVSSKTDKLNVAELSHPAAFTRPVLVCEPAPVNMNPFQVYGNNSEQTARSVVELVDSKTVRFKVAALSQPAALVSPVLVCEPALAKVNPFQL